MACIYYYKNHKFDSELELDNYLLGKAKYESKYGDIVFSLKESQLQQKQRLDELKEKNKVAWDEYVDARHKGIIKLDEDGDYYIDLVDESKLKYLGVNRFLDIQHKNGNINDDLLFPHVDMEAYFKGGKGHTGRFEDWKNGKFNKVEEELFFAPGETKAPIPESELNDKRKLLEDKWNAQGRSGDIVHEILQEFFSNDDKNNPVRDMDETSMFNHIKTKIQSSDKYKWLEFNGFVDDNIRSSINTAKKIFDNIKKLTGCNSDELVFYPEYIVTGLANDTKSKQDINLFGKIDLLVVDKNCNFHIIDYKTSIKDYTDFGDPKRLGYTYQLTMYKQMLENQGFPVRGCQLHIAPIKIHGFEKGGTNGFQFNGVSFDQMDNITGSRFSVIAGSQIENFMPSKHNTIIGSEDLHINLTKFMSTSFTGINVERQITPEFIEKELESRHVFDKKNDNDEYEDHYFDTTTKTYKVVKAKDKKELIDKVLAARKAMLPRRQHLTEICKSTLKKCIEARDPNAADFPPSYNRVEGSSTQIRDLLSKYCNQEWEVEDLPEVEQYGVIVLNNKNTGQKDFVRVSTNALSMNYHKFLQSGDLRKKRTKITSKFENDAQAEQKMKRLVLDGTYGNMELMEMMMIISSITGLESSQIGNIQVMNPNSAQFVTASNEQLLMNFNTLCKYSGVTNNFDNGNIKLSSYYDLTLNLLSDIWSIREAMDNGWNGEYKKIKELSTCKSLLDKSRQYNVDDKIQAIEKLIYEMRTKFEDLQQDTTDRSKLISDKNRLYNMALFALAELKGINFRQQNEDHSKWFSSVAQTVSKGLSGNMIDNPGNLDSETLNLITSLVKESFQNTRDAIQKEKATTDKLVRELKERLNFTYLKENIGFNQTDLYKPLYREVEVNGTTDLYFRKVNEVPPEYQPLLKHMLRSINMRRHKIPESQIDNILNIDESNEDYSKYYQVPLLMGDFDSQVSSRGLMNSLLDKLRWINPMNWKDLYADMERKLLGLGETEKRAAERSKQALVYKMENMFDKGEKIETRLQAIEDAKGTRKNAKGVDFLERNAETLMLKHAFAYEQQKNIDAVFPLIQASMAHLSIQGMNVNDKFVNDKSYLDMYIRSKIKNESIIDPNFQGAAKVTSMLKQAASKLTLAFTPVQLFYQPLQGLWTDIRLMIQKPDGKEAFTFNHFKTSLKLLTQDLFNFSGKPTLLSKINELYALNDMDMNRYIDNITKNKKGFLYNFENMAFKFASRPDYYNRLAIFLCQMQGDGCLEAHSIVNGELKYDWTKDKRFSKFAQAVKNGTHKTSKDPEIIKQRSLYYAVATQFANEGVLNEKGEPFVVDMNDPKPLPKAYTSKQAEGYKSLADDIYGYYSNENKSLIQSTAFGSMWLQFKTFWSGKKNQYLQSGGVRMRGSWEPVVEIEKDADGKPTGNKIEYFYGIDENGDIDYTKIVKKDELPPEKQIAPVVQWKGQWQEGIAVTMAQLGNPRNIIKKYYDLAQEDPDLARCYRSNVIQLLYDLSLWLIGGALLGGILGDWLKELLEDNRDNDDFIDGVKLAAANVAVWTVKNSFMDFNMFESIGSPLTRWTPFALQFTTNTINNLGKYVTGSQDLWDTIVRTNGSMKQIKPIFDAIKPEQYRSRLEGGTWESSGGRTGGGGASGNW